MGKRKRKAKKSAGQPAKYLSGATWRDVLAGRAVTAEEVERQERRKGLLPGRCLSCQKLNMCRFGRGWKPTCVGCGGVVKEIG